MMSMVRKHPVACLLALLAVMFLPWLGESLFNTKGEPREAIVAVSMIDSGNWILPESFGNDIPYKPPFLAWCIALLSLVTGHVSEYVSRLPSAIAAIALAVATCRFFTRHTGDWVKGVLTAVILVSTIEVWRAASACRVDMLFTAFIVGSLYSLYGFYERGGRGLPWMAILLMTCGFLTKGPVGMLLPCGVTGLWRLLRGDRFWPLAWKLGLSGLLAALLPLLWYFLAYRQGGQEFLDLVIEENFGRFTGNMSYASHENPVWYNFQTVAAGILPYTLLAVMALFAVKWKKLRFAGFKPIWRRFRSLDSVSMFALVVTVAVFVFYCIPKSKRSVYLLPIYPFIAYFLALLILWLKECHRSIIKSYFAVVSSIAVIASAGAVVFLFIVDKLIVTDGLVGKIGAIAGGVAAIVTLAVGISALNAIIRNRDFVSKGLLSVVSVLIMVSAAILPPVLSSKSVKPVAEILNDRYDEKNVLYGYNSDSLLRHYELNFYMDDRIRVFDRVLPESGDLVVVQREYDELCNRFAGDYEFDVVESFYYPSLLGEKPEKKTLLIVRFAKH